MSLIKHLFEKDDVIQTHAHPPRSERAVLNGVLWILRSGARWCDLPARFPPYQPAIAGFRLGRATELCAGFLKP
jgi:Transposase and inactivated derivatives